MNRDSDARQRILDAATEVFVDKGLSGARMQEIADRVQINKAMLHYYFTSKEKLYETVVSTAVQGIMERIQGVLKGKDVPTEKRFLLLVDTYLDSLSKSPHLPRLVVMDLLAGGETVMKAFQQAQDKTGFVGARPAIALLQAGIHEGVIHELDPKHTLISTIGMVAFSFLAEPLLSSVLQIEDRKAGQFFADRRRNVMEILQHGVLKEQVSTRVSTIPREDKWEKWLG